MSVTVTLNGVSVEQIINEMVREELRIETSKEVKCMTVKSILSKSRSTTTFRNHSGARSGKCRIIYQRGELCG